MQKQSKHSSTDEWIRNMRYISILEYYSAIKKNGFESVLMRWMKLEPIIQKAMAPHSSTLAWKIPWREEPGRRQSMESLRVGRDWATSLSLFSFIHWRRKWQPTPVLLPRESRGWGSLVGCHLWGGTESDTTEVTEQQQQHTEWSKSERKTPMQYVNTYIWNLERW